MTLMLALSGGNLLYVGVNGAFADATCQILAQYTGSLSNKPVFTGLASCTGNCPTSGDCIISPTDPPMGYTSADTCACPSGGGTAGCNGKLASKVIGGLAKFMLVCAGSCADGEVCDWIDTPTPEHQSGTWAKCKCQ